MDPEIENTIHQYRENQKKAKFMVGFLALGILIITAMFFWGAKEYTNTQKEVEATKNGILKLQANFTEMQIAFAGDRVQMQTVINQVNGLRASIEDLRLINSDAQKALYVAEKHLQKTPLTPEEAKIMQNAYELEASLIQPSAGVVLLRGVRSMQDGDSDKALEYFQQVKDNPDFTDIAHWATGRVYFAQKDFDAARKEYDAALYSSNNALKSGVLVDRGLTWVRLHSDEFPRLKRALEDYTKAISLGANYPVVYRRKGLVELRLGNVGQATRDFDKAVALSANSEELASAIENLGLMSIHQQDWSNAIDRSMLVLKVYPKSSWNWAIRTIAAHKQEIDIMKNCSLERWIAEGGDPSSSIRYYLPKEHWDYLTELYNKKVSSRVASCNV